MTLLSGTILTFPIFLCHLKIDIIKESSVTPLSKSRDYSISILPMKISIYVGILPIKKSLATEVTRPFDETCLSLAFYNSATGYEKCPTYSLPAVPYLKKDTPEAPTYCTMLSVVPLAPISVA